MGSHRLKVRAKPRSAATLVLGILVFLILICTPTAGLVQTGGGSSMAASSVSSTSTGAIGSQAVAAPPAPSAPQWPFLRVVTVLLSGLVISAARLARQFRRFWGLGVFTNVYAVLFLIFGVSVCGIPVTSEGALSSIPHLEFLGPWIADVSGIIVAVILPIIHLKPQAPPAAGSQVRDLEGVSSSNPVLAVIEDGIRDRILVRMQAEIVAASRRYDWDTIKLAAHRALEEEMTIRPLEHEQYDAVRQSIESFGPDPDSRVDSRKKYEALLQLLRWCSFKRLRRGLDAAVREAEI